MKNVLIIDPNWEFYSRAISVLKKSFDVEVAPSCSSFMDKVDLHSVEGGLNYYDFIFLEPSMDPEGYFSQIETEGGVHTGWFMYSMFMKDITSKVIILTYPIGTYFYKDNGYPERVWGPNVLIQTKYGFKNNDFYLVDIINKTKIMAK